MHSKYAYIHKYIITLLCLFTAATSEQCYTRNYQTPVTCHYHYVTCYML